MPSFGLSGEQAKAVCKEWSINQKEEINDLGFILTVIRDGTYCATTKREINSMLENLYFGRKNID